MTHAAHPEPGIVSRTLRRVLRRPPPPSLELPEGALTFGKAEKVLQILAQALSDSPPNVRAAKPKERAPATDSRSVMLPEVLSEFDDKETNFQLYKLMLIHQITQINEGTFTVHEQFSPFEFRSLVEDLFACIEGARIDRALQVSHRGMAEVLEMVRKEILIRRTLPPKATSQTQAVEALMRWSLGGTRMEGLHARAVDPVRDCVYVIEETLAGTATAQDSIRVAAYCYNRLVKLPGPYANVLPVGYRGEMRTAAAAAVLTAYTPITINAATPEVPILSVEIAPPTLRTKMTDDMNFAPSKIVVRESVRADDSASHDGEDNAVWTDIETKRIGPEVELTEPEKAGAFVYDEWSYETNTYRPQWAALRERTVLSGPPSYVDSVMEKHRSLIAMIRRQFDALRPEYRRLRKQPDGEEIDLDSLVEATANRAAGVTPEDNVYISRQANRRDIAVAFLVDLSGSAGGWVGNNRILDIEREAMVLMAQALQVLNDRYAIYGFSSSTRKQVDLFIVKDFNETYNQDVRLRIGGLTTHSYTRMGPAVRHVARRLDALDARIKLLMMLSDGKPNDFDGYSGRYAIEDSRMALAEARSRGIRTFCLTIDSRAREYLPQLFGEGGYTMLNDVTKLPGKLPELYRRLTTR